MMAVFSDGGLEQLIKEIKACAAAPAGPPGPSGEDGVTPDIQVGTVTTLSPGQSATVNRQPSSPDSAPVFDFGIPGGASDHRLLTHREDENQHPISSIIRLEEKLDTIPTAMTAEQLRKILVSIQYPLNIVEMHNSKGQIYPQAFGNLIL